MSRTNRFLISLAIGLAAGAICYAYQVRFDRSGSDLGWVLQSEPALLAGQNPYLATAQTWPLRYPLATLLALLPLAWMPLNAAAGVFFGLSSAALAYALTRSGRWPLLLFIAFPFWGALQVAQWSPLMCVFYLYPALVSLTILKPSLGLPVVLSAGLTRRDVAIAAVVVAVSFAILPSWPFDMLAMAAGHPHVIPVLTAPGIAVLLLAAVRWRVLARSRGARLVAAFAFIPQTLFYDTLLLGLAAETPRSMLLFVVASWVGYVGWYFAPVIGLARLGDLWLMTLLYLPIAIAAFRRAPAPLRADPLPEPQALRALRLFKHAD